MYIVLHCQQFKRNDALHLKTITIMSKTCVNRYTVYLNVL